jgi:hypothetical protein
MYGQQAPPPQAPPWQQPPPGYGQPAYRPFPSQHNAPRKPWPARHKALTAILGLAALIVIIVIVTSATDSPKPLTAFQQCVQAYEQHPSETAQQIIPATPGCRTIPLGQAKVTALMDAAQDENPATAQP